MYGVFLWDCWKKERKTWYEPPHDKTNKMACAPSKDSDQPEHLPSLIKIFTVRMKKAQVLSNQFIKCTAKTLIRLGGCPGWSESSLGAQIMLLVLSRGSSYQNWSAADKKISKKENCILKWIFYLDLKFQRALSEQWCMFLCIYHIYSNKCPVILFYSRKAHRKVSKYHQ